MLGELLLQVGPAAGATAGTTPIPADVYIKIGDLLQLLVPSLIATAVGLAACWRRAHESEKHCAEGQAKLAEHIFGRLDAMSAEFRVAIGQLQVEHAADRVKINAWWDGGPMRARLANSPNPWSPNEQTILDAYELHGGLQGLTSGRLDLLKDALTREIESATTPLDKRHVCADILDRVIAELRLRGAGLSQEPATLAEPEPLEAPGLDTAC